MRVLIVGPLLPALRSTRNGVNLFSQSPVTAVLALAPLVALITRGRRHVGSTLTVIAVLLTSLHIGRPGVRPSKSWRQVPRR
jgi:hypothetical protein